MLVNPPKNGLSFSARYDTHSKNIVVTYDLPNGVWETYIYLSSQKRYVGLGRSHAVGNQFDNGADLFDTVSDSIAPRTRNFVQYSDGKKIGSVRFQESVVRIGSVLQANQDITDLNGNLLIRCAQPVFGKSTPGYLGRLIWSGTRRLAIIGKNDIPSDVKEVVEILPSWKKGKRVWLSDYAMGFSEIIGNPDTGAFAVFEESNRSKICTGVFSRDLREYGNSEIAGKLFCLDGTTGKAKWHSQADFSAYWLGDKVISGQNILDGKTGRVIGRVPWPPTNFKQQFGFYKNTFVACTRDNRIAVYQLKL